MNIRVLVFILLSRNTTKNTSLQNKLKKARDLIIPFLNSGPKAIERGIVTAQQLPQINAPRLQIKNIP